MRLWKRDLADTWIERKGGILKMFMDWHCMGNFWLSHMRLCKVMPLLQNILSDSMDGYKWKLIYCKDKLEFLWAFCCCPLLHKMYRNFPGYSILWLLVLLQSQLLWQFLLSILPNLFFLAHVQKWHWHSNSSNWATSSDRLHVFVCSLCTRSWKSMGLFGTTVYAQCWHSGHFLAGGEEADLGHEAWQRVCWQQLVM